jgi:hypothetical protein
MGKQDQSAGKHQATTAQEKGGFTQERQERLRHNAPAALRTSAARRIGHYKTQSKFVGRNHPFGDDARFRAGLPSLQDILDLLKRRYGKDKLKKFEELKLDPEEIGNWLRRIGASSDKPIEWPRNERRDANQLANRCRKLAADIERGNKKWPFWSRSIPADFIEWSEQPRVLRSYADAWKKDLKHPYRSARSPRNKNIIRLLAYVTDKTGRFHYEEVADLLNATDAVYGWEWCDRNGNCTDRWSAENLKLIIGRHKKQVKK